MVSCINPLYMLSNIPNKVVHRKYALQLKNLAGYLKKSAVFSKTSLNMIK